MSAGPFIVAARRLAWIRVALAPDAKRLLVFDGRRNADECALGVVAGGMDEAIAADFEQGDEAIVAALDVHDAPVPCTFEIEIAAEFERRDWWLVAFAYGFATGRRMDNAFGRLN